MFFTARNLVFGKRHRKRKSRRLFALFYSAFAKVAEKGQIGRLRHQLLQEAYGTVLEVGAGTGENIKHYPPMVGFLALTEPESAMLKRLTLRKERNFGRTKRVIVQALAENLPFANETFDFVVATLVFCSVQDMSQALMEAARVLKPQGRLLVFEHIRSPNHRTANWQRRLNGAWARVAGGCHLDRATGDVIEACGFVPDDVQFLDLDWTIPLVEHHVFGSYRKSA